jgi:polyphosphate glucokinase
MEETESTELLTTDPETDTPPAPPQAEQSAPTRAKRAAHRRVTPAQKTKVLVIDVGGTHVKLLATGQKEHTQFDSGPKMTCQAMISQVKKLTKDWGYSRISLGFPGPVAHGRVVAEPFNLGPGWVRCDFAKAFGCPVKLINDAAMQALGSYGGGRMLFLGLGTGLGSALIVDGVLEPLELAHLPYKKRLTYEDFVGERGLVRLGKKKWRKEVAEVAAQLQRAMEADYVVFGGGNARLLKNLPRHYRLGDNSNSFTGGFRLWDPRFAKKLHGYGDAR